MRNVAIFLAVLLAMIVDLRGLGPRRAFADDLVGSVPKEATGFVGTLTGLVLKVGNPPGWDSIKVTQVLSYAPGNTDKLKLDDLNAAWKGKPSTIIAAQKDIPFPAFQVGDMVIVTAKQFEAHLRFTKVALFKPGEEEPNGYLFVKKTESDGKVSLLLRKMFDEKSLVLPMEKGPDGKMAPQADLLNTVNALAENTAVVVTFDSGAIKSIKAYEPPKRVEFVKKVSQNVDADTTAKPAVPAHVLTGMEVTDNGATATLLIDPKNASASALAAKIASFKPGQFLLIHSTTDSKGAWLEDARLDPDQAKPGAAAMKH